MGLIRGVSGLLGAITGVLTGLLRGVLALVLALVATVLLIVAAVLCVTILLLPLGIPLGLFALGLYGKAIQLLAPGSTRIERALGRQERALRDGGARLRKRLHLAA